MLAAFLACAVMAAPQVENPYKPLAVYSGGHSQIKKQRFELIEDAKAWKQLLAEHNGAELNTKLNFDTQCVACLFFGPHAIVPSVARMPVESKSAVRIRYNDSFQFVGGVELPELHPWVFVVMDRSKLVVIEQESRILISDPPKWKERARFPSKDKK